MHVCSPFAKLEGACQSAKMLALVLISIALLIWTATFCIRKTIADFRGPKPASGLGGLLAVAGALVPLALLTMALLVSRSGI